MKPNILVIFLALLVSLCTLKNFAKPNQVWAHQVNSNLETVSPDGRIQWLDWGKKAFARAKHEDKLILLDLTAVWCHACHVMDETTYIDPAVIKLLTSAFIPIRVETDHRPDIEARYKNGGWPTTSILLPSGEIVYQANSLTPEEMLSLLEETQTLYREHKQELFERAADVWNTVEKAKRARARSQSSIDMAVADHMVSIMKQHYDHVYGGFGDAPKFFEPDAITFAFETHYWKQDANIKEMALFTLNQQLKLFDPVWGGFYRYAEQADWSSPHYEKLLPVQAQNVLNYLDAYQMTKNEDFRAVVEGTIKYVARFLADPDQGGFFASQDADVRHQSDPMGSVPGKTYFSLKESKRLVMGLPYTDRSVYTGWNGLMAKSFLRASPVLDDPRLRDFALKTLNTLFGERYRSGRGMSHVAQDVETLEFGLLQDQVWFADALVEAHIATGQVKYRDWAEQIIQDVVSRLEDKQGGGYYDRPSESSSQGLLKFPYKDLKVNASLVQLFSDLYYVTGKSTYQELAKQGLHFLLGRQGPLPVANIGLAINRYLRYPVHIVVVGPKDDPAADRLLQKALNLYVPGKVVKQLDPSVDQLSLGDVTFPNTKVSLAYVCTDKLCSSPIQDPETLGDHLEEVMAGLRDPSNSIPLAVTGSS